MKTLHTITIIILLFLTTNTQCQSWQWGKRGGASDQLDTNSGDRQEEVTSIVTDSNKNVYLLSAMGKTNPNVDGNPKTNYGDSTTKTDFVLSSFACDGSYRWSKVIGGGGFEKIHTLQIDSQNNIYVAGRFGGCSDNSYPPRIENDVIIPQSPEDCSLIFISKFNSDGVLQWFRRPQPAGTPSDIGSSNTTSKGLAIDNFGNTYWLVWAPEGSYADDAFVNTMSGSNWFVFKYDTAGNFLNATYLDMQLGGSSGLKMQFYRNPYNGHFFVVSRIDTTEAVTVAVGGQNVTHSFFMASFDTNGTFLWKRENTNTLEGTIQAYNLVFDSDNSIYFGGRMASLNTDSFLGFQPIGSTTPGFIMKLNPNADGYVWGNNHNKSATEFGGLALNGNELGFTNTCFGENFSWAGQTFVANTSGNGQEALLARFNKNTGDCLGLTKIAGDIGYNDTGTALAVDASGDYILGGAMGHQLFVNANTTLLNNGPQSDFFVAKYSTSLCSPLAVNEVVFPIVESLLVVAPNPAKNETTVFYNFVNGKSNRSIMVLDVLGRTINSFLPKENKGNFVLNTSGYANGTYFVFMKEDGKIIERTKLVVEN